MQVTHPRDEGVASCSSGGQPEGNQGASGSIEKQPCAATMVTDVQAAAHIVAVQSAHRVVGQRAFPQYQEAA